ncbi:hypothetical protein [Dactylosporangium sp. CA-233914]|uniref:hypothetical protein n=1 Tax=Dactylosporangium sp. CA-233914 TaxID=3239934 RepID=UPI003D92C821
MRAGTGTRPRPARTAPVVPPDSAAAEELARRLRAMACLPGTSATPAAWPCDVTLLDWLRRMTYPGLYTWAAEENLARRWIGGDIFGTRRPPGAPGFLAGVDVRTVAPHLVAPLLRRLSMTRPAPAPAELTPRALAREAGPVSRCARDGAARRWEGSGSAPQLPATTVIPHVVHGIWLGRALPASNSFWANYGAAADAYAGEVDFVLWTDIPRHRFDAARTGSRPAGGRPDPLAAVRELLDWARAHGIHLVSVAEVFHATAPMTLHHPYALELDQGVPRAFAAASDHLRIEVVHRFGGLYADGDLHLAELPSPVDHAGPAPDDGGYQLFRGRWTGPPDANGPARLTELFDRVAASRTGFTLNALTDQIVLNDVILAPAGHPALALWLEGARYNYLRDQRELFGAEASPPAETVPPRPGEPDSWTWAITPIRSGRVHQWLLSRLGLTGADLVKPAPAVRGHSELSWLPPTGGEPPVPCAGPDPLPTLRACVGLLRWQHLSRAGDLYLTGVAPLIRGLPDPDTGWTALLLAFADLSTDLGPVASVTDRRRNQDGSLDVVELPAAARALLERAQAGQRPDGPWFGAAAGTGDECWFLGERTVPARLRAARREDGELRPSGQA